MSQHSSATLVAGALGSLLIASLMTVPASAATTASTTPAAARSAAPLAATGARPHREVFGYAYMSNLTNPSVGYTTWNFSNLSTLALFALHQNTDGSFAPDSQWKTWTSSTVTSLISYAHARGVKVVPTISFHDGTSTNGGTVNTRMCQILTTGADHAVARIAGEVKLHKADGVNIDYEGSNQLCPNGVKQGNLLVGLMAKLRTALAGYYISIATYMGSYYTGGFFRIDVLEQYVDSMFVMAYDANYSNYKYDPLTCATYCGSPNAPVSRYNFNLKDSVAGYLGVGVPAAKIILGVPYYGNTSCVPGSTRPGPNAVPFTDSRAHKSVPRYLESRHTWRADGVTKYKDSYDRYSPTDSYSTWWDADYRCWRQSYWDNYYALSAKYDLVNQQNLRGVGMWTLDYGGGAPELWSLLHIKFGGCIGATAAASPTSPQAPGSVLHLTATATGCSAPAYAYYVQYPNGTWYKKRGFAASSAFDWNTAGLPFGNYTVHVWANQSGTQQSTYESFGELKFTLADMPSCATASLTPATATQLVTTTFSFTAASSGCPTVQYAYWVQSPDGSWTMKRGFTSDPAYAWSTAGLRPGTYTMHVWANQYGHSTQHGEAIGESVLTVTGCTAATITPTASTQQTGTTVNFAATSSSCPSPLYAYWVRYPNGTWSLKRPFSATAAWAWNTTGLAPGRYVVHVWANQAGADTKSLDAMAESVIVLAPPCAAAKVAPASGSGAAGTPVTFTGSAAGCPNPLYQFWIQDTKGIWHKVRAWSTSASWTWDNTGWGKGTYKIHVWINEPGSNMATYQSLAESTYTLT